MLNGIITLLVGYGVALFGAQKIKSAQFVIPGLVAMGVGLLLFADAFVKWMSS